MITYDIYSKYYIIKVEHSKTHGHRVISVINYNHAETDFCHNSNIEIGKEIFLSLFI